MDESIDFKTKILAWLAGDYNVSIETIPRNAPVEWAIKVEAKAPSRIAFVVQKPKSKEAVVLTMGIALSQKHRDVLAGLPSVEREKFSIELLQSLIMICPQCKVLAQPSPRELKTILISREITLEALSRQILVDSSTTLINMFIITVLRLNALGGGRQGAVVEGYM
ncbi:MAG: DUF2299 family protein [Aeropyrum sp.]|nr:DUF2299 family protein [Aeropyrum sp.]MCE4615568.1 DUF2299 family protein [Aeropyrum sp.]